MTHPNRPIITITARRPPSAASRNPIFYNELVPIGSIVGGNTQGGLTWREISWEVYVTDVDPPIRRIVREIELCPVRIHASVKVGYGDHTDQARRGKGRTNQVYRQPGYIQEEGERYLPLDGDLGRTGGEEK
jgi:hypothetical protein